MSRSRTTLTIEERQVRAKDWRRQWNTKNPDRKLSQLLKYKYGITSVEYNKLLKAQGGLCWICRKPPGRRRLAVDHCHTSGVIRGLLCARCNMLLGYAGDSAETLRRAARYLGRKIARSIVVKGMQRASETVLAPVQAPEHERALIPHDYSQDRTSPWLAALSHTITC